MDKPDIVKASYTEFVNALDAFHRERTTGCVFFTSSIKRSGQIFITNGEFENVSYAYKKGREGLALMTQIELVKYRLGKQRVNAKIDPTLPTTHEILSYLQSHTSARPNQLAKKTLSADTNALSDVQKTIIENCMLEIIGPMADMIAEEHVHDAKNIQEALAGIQEDIDDKTFTLLKNALDKKL